MPQIRAERVTAEIDGEVVVFLIGMRINRFWKLHKWVPVARAMTRMLRELEASPQAGFLGVERWLGNPTLMVQYWRSFEHLERYATDPEQSHRPAWAAFNRAVASNVDVGIWHETYRVRPGDFECIYNNMPAFGLARATRTVAAGGRRETAPDRMGAPAPTDLRGHTRAINDRTYAAWNARDAEAVAAVFAGDAVLRESGRADPFEGREAIRGRAAALLRAFPDLGLERLELVIEGERHADRWVMTGTHRGPLFGMPPTGRRVRVEGATFTRLGGDGLVSEDVHFMDTIGLLAQLRER